MILRIPDGAQVRGEPPTGTGVVAGELRRVVIVNSTGKNARKERPHANRNSCLVLADRSYLLAKLGKGVRDRAYDQRRRYERTPCKGSRPNS